MESVLDLPGKRINTFLGLKELSKRGFTTISLANNALSSFEHFGTHPNLWELRLESNRISSFFGMTKQRSLEALYLAGNPIASNPHYRIMALLTIGFSLKTIDGVKVDAQERETARRLGPNAALAVSYGWLLDLSPRSAAEYDEIICEVRRERRLSKPAGDSSSRTISAVLSEEASKENVAAGSVSQGKQALTPEAAELQNKALVHLSNRVAQLERQLMMTELELSQERSLRAETMHPMYHARQAGGNPIDSAVEGLSIRDVQSAESIQFVDGIVLRTNVQLSSQKVHKPELNVCAVIDRETISFRHSFTRARIVDCALPTIEDVQLDFAGHVLLIVSSTGAVFDVHVTDEATLVAMYKLLFLRRGLVAPLKALRRKEAEPQRGNDAALAPQPKPSVPAPASVHSAESLPKNEVALPASEPEVRKDGQNAPEGKSLDLSSSQRPIEPDAIVAPPAQPVSDPLQPSLLQQSVDQRQANQRTEQQQPAIAPSQAAPAPATAPQPKPKQAPRADVTAAAQEFNISSDSDDEVPVVAARSSRAQKRPVPTVPADSPNQMKPSVAAKSAPTPAVALAPTPAVVPAVAVAPDKVTAAGVKVADEQSKPEAAPVADASKRLWRGKMIQELLVDSDSDN